MKIEVRHTKTLEFSMDGESISLPILFEFNILYSGWELDSVGYIVKYCGSYRLVASNHGKLQLILKGEAIPYLTGFLLDYETAIDKTKRALSFLDQELE